MTKTWEILGHRDEVEQLAAAAERGRPHQAYLFTGAAHVGKRTTAERFAQALICERRTACGQCGQCLLFSAGNHPDFLALPSEGALTIKQIRTLQETLSLAPHSAAFRVAVIPRAERLGIPAQNALLKLLEEPPARTVLILTAAAPEQLLPTTVSRLRQLRFRRPAASELVEELGGRTPDVSEAVAAAGGRPGLARTLLDDPEGRADRRTWGEWLATAVSGSAADRLRVARQAAETDHPELVLEHWAVLVQQALRAATGSDPENDTIETPARTLAAGRGPAELRQLGERLLVARNRLGYNPNTVVLFEQTLTGIETV